MRKNDSGRMVRAHIPDRQRNTDRTEGDEPMAIINGCQDRNHTPQLEEVSCPECGEEMEVFMIMRVSFL